MNGKGGGGPGSAPGGKPLHSVPHVISKTENEAIVYVLFHLMNYMCIRIIMHNVGENAHTKNSKIEPIYFVQTGRAVISVRLH